MKLQPVPRGNGFAVSRDLNPVLIPVESLKPLGRETRKHPASQVRKLAESLEQFGSRGRWLGPGTCRQASQPA